MVRKYLSFVAILSMFLACSSRTTSSRPSKADTASHCEIDAKKICEAVKDLRSVRNTGYADTQSQQEQNLNPTSTWTHTLSTPDNTDIEVTCDINVRHHRVVYARTVRGATLTANDVDYLHNQGFCTNVE